jgi:thiol-disulfide isomerase/thioredoxin
MIKRLVLCSILTAAILFLFSGCSKKNMTTDEFIADLVNDVEIDLSKINSEVVVQNEADKALKSYKDDYSSLMDDIDSLIEKYPDSYDMKAIKINILRQSRQESDYVNELYKKDSLNSHHQFFHGTSLEPQAGKEFFVKMIKEKKDDPFGYLGLAFTYLYSRTDDLQIPAKLAYISIIKDHTVDDSFEVLSYMFRALNRSEDQAMLNGIMLVKDPSSMNAFENLFYYYFEKNDHAKAKELLETFVKNNPDLLSNSGIAERYLDINMPEPASEFVAKAREAGETDPLLDFTDAKLNIINDKAIEGLTLLEKYCAANQSDRNLVYRITDDLFVDKLINEERYRSLLKKIEGDAPTIGDRVTELTGKYLEGTDYDPKELSGKVYLIDFWAEWCSPCKMEMPNVLAVYNELNPKGFEIIGVNLDEKKENAQKYVTDNNIKWKHIYSGAGWKDANVESFRVQGIPATFLVDKNGIIRYKNIRGKELLMGKVTKLLDEKGSTPLVSE